MHTRRFANCSDVRRMHAFMIYRSTSHSQMTVLLKKEADKLERFECKVSISNTPSVRLTLNTVQIEVQPVFDTGKRKTLDHFSFSPEIEDHNHAQ